MKWSSALHFLTSAFGIIGFMAILGAWLAGEAGTVVGLSQAHLFNDATVLLLASISSGIGVLIHRQQEQKQ